MATDTPESDDDDKESEAASVSNQLSSRTPSISNLSVSSHTSSKLNSTHTTPTKKKPSGKSSAPVRRDG